MQSYSYSTMVMVMAMYYSCADHADPETVVVTEAEEGAVEGMNTDATGTVKGRTMRREIYDHVDFSSSILVMSGNDL